MNFLLAALVSAGVRTHHLYVVLKLHGRSRLMNLGEPWDKEYYFFRMFTVRRAELSYYTREIDG